MMATLPAHLIKVLRQARAAGLTLHRDGHNLLLPTASPTFGPTALAALEAIAANQDELARALTPRVSSEEAERVRGYLGEAGVAAVQYVVDSRDAEAAVAMVVATVQAAGTGGVMGLDMETMPLAHLLQPIPIALTQTGSPAARQPKTGVAGLTLDPYRSQVRTVQVWDGGPTAYVFDVPKVGWSVLTPLWALPLAIFNATFELKRLLREAKHAPTARIYDVMTACRLTHGVRPSLQQASRLYFGMDLPKTLGASDWSVDALSPEQLDYAALDAVLCVHLWRHQRALFTETDEQAQLVVDEAAVAIGAMELAGLPIDRTAHVAQIRQWKSELAVAQQQLRLTVPGRDLTHPTELQSYLHAILTEGELEVWPRTKRGKLVADRNQLMLNQHIPGIGELLLVRSAQKLLDAFGEGLLDRINPVTGRLHTSFLLAGAITGRLASAGPNIQQMPKSKSKEFRRIFVAPPDQLILALDYNQIELRAAAQFVSDWCGQPSILQQAFAEGLDAHTATAQRMTGKTRPEDVTPEERQAAKPCNFGLLYRMGARGFFNYLRTSFEPSITFEEASRRHDLFFAGYPDLARWQDEYSRYSRECGFTSTVAGRKWRWVWNAKSEEDVDPDAPFYEDQLSGFNGALAVNLPIQGSCAEVMMLALARLHLVLHDQPATLIATVHDEAVLLVPNDMQVAVAIAGIARKEMVAAFLDVFPNAPTQNLVEPKVGATWSDLQSLAGC
jgi:DNA polymerase I-like protein with 3'-5' exonuclease and polymerase domains